MRPNAAQYGRLMEFRRIDELALTINWQPIEPIVLERNYPKKRK